MDTYKSKVVVYYFENPDVPRVYSFGEKIPVGIFEGLELAVPEKMY